MANHVSSLKRARQTETKTAVNRANKSKLRGTLRTLREAIAEGLRIALGNRLAQRTQRSAELALVGAVHRGFGLSLTCALQRGNMICHKLSSLNPHQCVGGNGMQATGQPSHSLPHSLQCLSLRNSSP